MPQPGANSIVNRFKKEKPMETGGAWRLMFFMLFVFLVFVFSYLGLTLGYKNYLEGQIANTTQAIDALAARVSADEQTEFLQFQYQLINLRDLIRGHVLASRLFPIFENNTNQRVQYSGLELDIPDSRLDLDGSAASYAVIAEQLLAYERMPGVLQYRLLNSELSEGGRIDFSVSLFFNPQTFRATP